MENREVRCRFAPSPTGYLHLGGARTALFNYLFARSRGGKHILRIEDTDRERSSAEATQAILDGLEWLNIGYDEGPFFQSERTAIYHDYARRLLSSGHAYACTCSEERLTEVRARLTAEGKKPEYDKFHRPAAVTPQPADIPTGKEPEPFVIRLRVPESGVTSFDDLIIGPVNTANEEIDDFVIVRSDGSPTYNFTVVVDDIEMSISHVIRGMDHVSNTPKQIIIYEALGAIPPRFGHVPMILGPDKKKLSKRHGATSVVEYRKDGYLADAFVNYLVRLGWSHGDQEIFTRDELERVFSLDHVGKSAAVFDQEKLIWVNSEHMKRATPSELLPEVQWFLSQSGLDSARLQGDPRFLKLTANLQERTKTLKEMAEAFGPFLIADDALLVEDAARKKHLTEAVREPLSKLLEELRTLEDFSEGPLEEAFKRVIAACGIGLGKLAQPVRVAVTGSTVSPPIFAVLEVLGRESSLRRLERALTLLG